MSLTVKEIKEELDFLGVEYKNNAKKDELLKLLEEADNQVAEELKKYVVLHDFKDLEDKGAVYFKGDTYPRKGLHVDDERIQELSSDENKIGKQLIKEQE